MKTRILLLGMLWFVMGSLFFGQYYAAELDPATTEQATKTLGEDAPETSASDENVEKMAEAPQGQDEMSPGVPEGEQPTSKTEDVGETGKSSAPVQEQPIVPPKPFDRKAMISAPFDQLRKLYSVNKAAATPEETPPEEDSSPAWDVELPTLAEQRGTEARIQQEIEGHLKELLVEKYITSSVSTHYVIQTSPVTKVHKKISKIKLPGFTNHVWVPIEGEEITGLVNRVGRYTTVFVIVSSPVSPFDLEVLRQKLDERVRDIDLSSKDKLRISYVPLAEPPGMEKEKPPAPEEPIAELKEESPPEEKKSLDQKTELKSSKQLLVARNAYFKNDLNQALDNIQRAIELNPESAQGYAMLGSIYYRLKWNNLARKHWKKSLELEPNNPSIIQYLERLEE